MAPDTEILHVAFEGRAWRETVDGMFEATGLVVTVMDRTACSVVHSTAQCSYCELAVPVPGSTLGACFDDPPHLAPEGVTRTTCRAGLPCYIAPVSAEGLECTVVVGGFVSATRERKLLFEKLLGRSVPQEQARIAVREIPILPLHQVEALVRVLQVNAATILEAAVRGNEHAVRQRELETIVEAGNEFAERRGMGPDLLEAVLARAMAIVSADSGSLMLVRPGTDFLELVVPAGESVEGARGHLLRIGEGIAGRVAQTGRSVLVTGDSDELLALSTHPGRNIATSVSVPLMREGSVLGVLNLNIASGGKGLNGDDLVLVERYAHLAALTIDNARAHGATKRAMFELMHLGELAKTLSGASDLEQIVQTAASVLEKGFDFKIGGVVLTGWGMDRAVAVVCGDVTRADIDSALGEATGRDTRANPFESVRLVTHLGSIAEEGGHAGDWSILTAELIVRDSVVGYTFVTSPHEGAFDSADHRLLQGLADHASVALERAAVLQRMREDLTHTITALSVTMDVTEHAPAGHADRVTDYAMSLGQEIGLDVEHVELLRFAGLLHDIGKMGISEEILLKPSRLTDDEMAEVRRHPEIGAGIVEQIEFLNALTPVIMHHHENWDGGGYPAGLAGEDIPLLARILAIADSFDAMTSESVYRKRLSYSQARTELLASAGSQFDPDLVGAFLEAMDRRALVGGMGLMVARQSQGPQLPS